MNARMFAWFGIPVIVVAACGNGAQSNTSSSSSGSGGGSVSSSAGTGGAGGSSAASTGGASASSSAGSGGGGDDGGTDAGVMNDLYVYPPGSMIQNQTYGAWGAAWWEWALSIPASTNPILNGPCDQQQPSGAFFLAGNEGGSDTRSCTVPAGTPLFFPILNAINRACPESSCAADANAAETAASHFYDTNPPLKLTLEIDGVSLTNLTAYRAANGVFDDTEGADPNEQIFPGCAGPIQTNSCGVAVGSKRAAAGDGYWFMVKPLASGSHVVHFVGIQPNFTLNVTYNLTVP